MPDLRTVVASNLAAVRERIARSLERAHRALGEVSLVGVTKYVSANAAAALAEAGCLDLGESRPQELWQKAEAVEVASVRWHLVGHLQRNKVRRTLPPVTMIHSVDSVRLLKAIDATAAEMQRNVAVLVEVNCSGEATKHGLLPQDLPALLATAEEYPHVAIRGLMTMATLEGGPSVARRNFAALRQLRDDVAHDVPDCVGLDELSMGMSADFEEAIAEGSTIVRIGTALWEGVD